MSRSESRESSAGESVRYRVRQKLFSLGEDYWVTDHRGERVYKIDGKVLRLRKALVLEDARGQELLKIHEHVLSWRDAMHIEAPNGTTVATVKKASITPLRARWTVKTAEAELYVTGDVHGHEYRIERDHETLAAVSKKWFGGAEEYGVEVFPAADPTLMVAIAAVLDATSDASP